MAINLLTFALYPVFGLNYQLLLSDQIVELSAALSDQFETGVFEVAHLGQCFFEIVS